MGVKTEALKALCQAKGIRYVGTRGNTSAPVCQLGEAPGADEDQTGLPFMGYAGKLLNKLLSEAGFSQNDCWFSNPYKIRPPGNDLSKLEERGIPRQVFIEQFFEELEEYKPTFIVANGAVPLEILCPFTIDRRKKEVQITKWRGSLLTSPRLPWPHYVVPNTHPAYVLRDWSDKDVNLLCHKKVREELDYWLRSGKLQPLPERQLIVNPTASEAEEYLHECLETPGHVSVDLELLGYRIPYTIALSYNYVRAMSLCFFEEGGTWTTQKLARIWRLLERILRTKKICGQNYSEFDANWLDVLGFSPGVDQLDDTRVRHHVLWAEMSHKLEFMTMQYTREPYYKDEGRGWRLGDDIARLKRYNCKDAAVTLEILQRQEEEFQSDPQKARLYYDYEMPLARRFFYTDKRGILVDEAIRQNLRTEITSELETLCQQISQVLGGKPVATNAADAEVLFKKTGRAAFNLSSQPQMKDFLKNTLQIKLRVNKDTHKETTGEESLSVALAETGNQTLRHILRVRELTKMLGTYVDAKLLNSTFYFSSSVAGTVGGRRSSKKCFLGYGSNAQNQPKHSDIGKKFREVFVSRPEKIFVSCDQVQAEDWIVQGIIADVSGDTSGVEELRSGVDRHSRLASQIFNIPLERCGKDSMERYLGKKTRHAANYDMQAATMSAELAKEGFFVPKDACVTILQKFHSLEPNIRRVFHQWVQEQVKTHRRLTTPLGRTRDFFGVHPTRDNGKIFREAYSYIPQSTVGDNTGLAVLFVEAQKPGLFIQEVHDSILLEVEDDIESILQALRLLQSAFHRVIRFQNGFELEIPIEFEFGYSLSRMTKCPANVPEDGLRLMLREFQAQQKALPSIIGGQRQQPSPQHSNVTSG